MSILKNIKNLLIFNPQYDNDFILSEEKSTADYDVRLESEKTPEPSVFKSIEKNLAYMKKRFTYPINNDIIIRELKLKENRKAFVVFIDGMVSSELVDLAIIETLQKLPYLTDDEAYKYEDEIIESFISHSQAMATDDFDIIIEEINFGSCAVFIDGFQKGFSLDVRDWGHRNIDKPETEQSIYGPQEAFAEMLRNNTALVRKIIKTEKLIAEGVKIGSVSKTRGVLLYISDIVNDNLVKEVKRRINAITADYIISIEEISMLVEDKSSIFTTQSLLTERPDRVARALTEGRVVLILNGSPRALVMPTNAFELTHAASDDYLRVPFANMARMVRIIAMFFSIFLPGLYIAITLFHQEIIPTYLLYSISASRENVPFPSVVELLLMDISFEMIREAGIRMPSPIGSTLGIVGGLILGQAAVSAKMVSPIMIIIIAITGIGSFATVDYSLGWSYRILRVIFLVLASFLGFYGIAIGILLYSLFIGQQMNFGISFLTPMPKNKSKNMNNPIFVNQMKKREKRPDFLKTKNTDAEPSISRKWDTNKKV